MSKKEKKSVDVEVDIKEEEIEVIEKEQDQPESKKSRVRLKVIEKIKYNEVCCEPGDFVQVLPEEADKIVKLGLAKVSRG